MTRTVISLDYDAFLTYDAEGILSSLLPDERYTRCSAEIRTTAFGRSYAVKKQGRTLSMLGFDKEKADAVLRRLPAAPVYAARDHETILSVLEKRFPGDKIRLFHMDRHHDFFMHEDRLSCGNWLYKAAVGGIVEKCVFYPCADSPSLPPEALRHVTAATELPAVFPPADLIFLAQSEMYVPPHTAEGFRYMRDGLKEHAVGYTEEPCGFLPWHEVFRAARIAALEAILAGLTADRLADYVDVRFLPPAFCGDRAEETVSAFLASFHAARAKYGYETALAVTADGYGYERTDTK